MCRVFWLCQPGISLLGKAALCWLSLTHSTQLLKASNNRQNTKMYTVKGVFASFMMIQLSHILSPFTLAYRPTYSSAHDTRRNHCMSMPFTAFLTSTVLFCTKYHYTVATVPQRWEHIRVKQASGQYCTSLDYSSSLDDIFEISV